MSNLVIRNLVRDQILSYTCIDIVITQFVVYQANKYPTSAELWCNGSTPDCGSGDSKFESSKL